MAIIKFKDPISGLWNAVKIYARNLGFSVDGINPDSEGNVALTGSTFTELDGRYPAQKYNTLKRVDDFLGITTLDFNAGLISDLAAFHFKYVRITVWWSNIELTEGVYTFTAYDTVITNILNAGMIPVIILFGSPNLYGMNNSTLNSVVTEAQRTAFANYVTVVTDRYKNHNIIWEIWNEPNFAWWAPQTVDSPVDYTNMVKRVYALIKATDPTGIVSTPVIGYSGYPGHIEWFVKACEAGLMDYTDNVSFHVYFKYEEVPPEILPPPETFLGDAVRDIRDIISKHTERQVPINLTEYGYSTVPDWDGLSSRAVTDEATRCKYLVREMLLGLIYGLNKVMIYSATANEADNHNIEHWFGLWGPTFAPKDSAYAVKTAMESLAGLRYVDRIYAAQGDFILRFIDADNIIHYAAWTIEAAHSATIGSTTIALTDTMQVVATTSILDLTTETDYPKYEGKKKLVGQAFPDYAETFNSPYNKATGKCAHASGGFTESDGDYAHSEGYFNTSDGLYGHAEGNHNAAELESAHAEGAGNIAGLLCHAEGTFNIGYGGDIYTVTAYNAVAKTLTLDTVTGLSVNNVVIVKRKYAIYLRATILAINGLVVTIDLTPSSDYTHIIKPISGRAGAYVSGANNLSGGSYSRASGTNSVASATHAFAHGIGLLAKAAYQAVFGKWNVASTSNLFIIGNGTSNTARSNALSVDASGNLTIAGNVVGNLTITGDTFMISTAKTPTSSSATGTAGQICHDVSYIYVCVATDTWTRIPLASW